MPDPIIWTVILAAGASSRFGGVKALAPWGHGTLLTQALGTARTASGDRVAVVTGAHAAEIAAAAGSVLTIHNAAWRDGHGSSIASAVDALAGEADCILIVPVDQPFITATHLKALAVEALSSGACVLTSDQGISGPPASIPAEFFPVSSAQRKGLKAILDTYATIEAPGQMRDIDTRADLDFLSKQAAIGAE